MGNDDAESPVRIAGDNKSQRDRIRKLSRAYIEQRLVAEMQALLEGYGASDFELRAVPAQDSDADPTLVLLPYRSIYANIEYVESQIRIERNNFTFFSFFPL